MTPISRGHAKRLGLRKPEPSLTQKLAWFIEHHTGVKCTPWQVFAMDHAYAGWKRPEPEHLAHFEIHADGRVVDNMDRIQQRGNGNANL